MKKRIKILFLVSLALNLALGAFQLFKYFEKENRISAYKNDMKRYTEQKFVNGPAVKKKFFDTLFIKFPTLINKKYLFANLWQTGSAWVDRTLPIYDTIVKPLRQDVGYVTITDQNEKYAKSVLKRDTSLINNFHFIYSSENFILAMNQELKIPFRKYCYPKCPLNIIFDTETKRIIFYDTVGISGPKYPQDSLEDKKIIASIKKALSELK